MIRRTFSLVSLATLLTVTPCLAGADAEKANQNPWFTAGQDTLQERLAVTPNTNRAKNVILFVADGFGISTLTAARIYDGQSRGESGEENVLPFERFPHTALVKTYNTNAQVSDSAGTASAMNTGVKTKAGVISIDGSVPVGDCEAALEGAATTLAERAEEAGMSTGVVSTARITHATPAAVYGHSASRDWEDDSDIPDEQKPKGCVDLAQQLVNFSAGDGLEVALGGGRGNFLPAEKGGRRTDALDLTAAWSRRYNNAAYVTNATELAAVNLTTTSHLLGLFSNSHMAYEFDRGTTDEPSIADMTGAAIQLLSRNDKGYYLMVEGGRVDHAHHQGNANRALSDAQAFANAVQTAIDMTDERETLILVTADHSHVFTMAGYPKRGNPILGLARGWDESGEPKEEPILAEDGKPYTTLGYQNGPGAVKGERPTLTDEIVRDPNFMQQALVPTRSESHAGEDVALFANGPWAHLVGGVLEQNVIYHIMDHALGLQERVDE